MAENSSSNASSTSSRDIMNNNHSHLTAENTISYQRQSVSKGDGRSKSLTDQAECNIETAAYYGLPLTTANQWDEEKNHGGDEWWSGALTIENSARYRPILTKIVNGIVAGTVRCLVVWSLDRVWRSVSIAGILIDLMGKHGCLLYDRNGEVDISTPDGRNKVLNNAIAAQHLREMAVVNSPRGVRKSREKGLVVVGSDVLGFRNCGNGRVRAIIDEIEMVRDVFAAYCSGSQKTTIARELMKSAKEKGMLLLDDVSHKHSIKRSPQTKDLVYLKQIDRILRDCRYQGRQPHERKEWPCPAFLIDGQPAVSPAQFEEAQRRLAREKRHGNRACAANHLAGLFRCGICGQGLQVNPNKQVDGTIKKYWAVSKYDIRSWCVHSLPTMTEPIMRSYTEHVLMPLLLVEACEMLDAGKVRAICDEIAVLETELRQHERLFSEKVTHIFDSGAAGMSSAMQVLTTRHETQMSALIQKLRELREQETLELLRSRETADAVALLSSWSQLDESQKRTAIHKVLLWVALLPSEDFASRAARRGVPRDHNREKVGAPPAGKVMFLTSWGTFHTAILKRVPNPDSATWHKILGIVPAEISECLGTAADLPDPGAFAAGLERSYQGRGYKYHPSEVMPGYLVAQEVATFESD